MYVGRFENLSLDKNSNSWREILHSSTGDICLTFTMLRIKTLKMYDTNSFIKLISKWYFHLNINYYYSKQQKMKQKLNQHLIFCIAEQKKSFQK